MESVELRTMPIEVREPFPAYAWPMVWEWLQPVQFSVFDDFGPKSKEEFVEYSLRVRANHRSFVVRIDGRIGGVITFDQVNPVTAIGHVLFARWCWGTAAPAEGLRQACARMFEGTTRKVLGLIPESNRLAIALAVRHGGKVEGLLRQHSQRGGQLVNAVAIGMTKEDFDGIQPGWKHWRQQQHDRHVEQREQDGERERVDAVPVLAGTVGAAVEPHAGLDATDHGRWIEPAATESTDSEREPDQLELRGGGRSHEPVPRSTRLRKERTSGRRSPKNGTGKTRRARTK